MNNWNLIVFHIEILYKSQIKNNHNKIKKWMKILTKDISKITKNLNLISQFTEANSENQMILKI